MSFSMLRERSLRRQFAEEGHGCKDVQIGETLSKLNAVRVFFHEIEEILVPSHEVPCFGGNGEVHPGLIIRIAGIRERMGNRVN